MLQRSILCMQGTQYATKRSILCRGAFCGPTGLPLQSRNWKCTQTNKLDSFETSLYVYVDLYQSIQV